MRSSPHAATSSERIADEATLQARLVLPGVPAVIEHGVTDAMAYVALSTAGRRIEMTNPGRALATVAAVGRVLHALALAGVVLPDADPVRFLQTDDDPRHPVLADLDGATPVSVAVAVVTHARIVADLARALRLADDDVARVLGGTPDLPTLVAALDCALRQSSPAG